ncbi:MAG: class I SAM-dependent methyltransferase [Candidatus Omnitrophota bacterium]|nr:class I SAM-dependent methyltransferase [Candidatus Omnitrophota bacterium]
MLSKILPSSVKRWFHDFVFRIVRSNSRRIVKYILEDRHIQEQLKARLESIEREDELFGDGVIFKNRTGLIEHALKQVPERLRNGLYLEFGVANGKSVNLIARNIQTRVYGFDSFEGLPEKWVTGKYSSAVQGKHNRNKTLPKVELNVELVRGWFHDTVPGFLRDHPGPVAFVHVDSDLYESARYIFSQLKLENETVIVFDEYFNFPAWKEGEYKAFQDFLTARGATARCIGYCPRSQQAAFVLSLNSEGAPAFA